MTDVQGTPEETGPESAQRPVLSDSEALRYTPENLFARGGWLHSPDGPWRPEGITPPPDERTRVVDAQRGRFCTVQQAVNAAVDGAGSRARVWIAVAPGVYRGVVYLPADAPPITVYGTGETPEQVRLELTLDARFTPQQYQSAVNACGEFQPGDPAWEEYQRIAASGAPEIGTGASAVVWAQSDGFQLLNLSVVNTLLDSVDGQAHQAVALRTDGDRVQLERLRLISRQDTLWLNSRGAPQGAASHISRVRVKDCYIEGDVDFRQARTLKTSTSIRFHHAARAKRSCWRLPHHTIFPSGSSFSSVALPPITVLAKPYPRSWVAHGITARGKQATGRAIPPTARRLFAIPSQMRGLMRKPPGARRPPPGVRLRPAAALCVTTCAITAWWNTTTSKGWKTGVKRRRRSAGGRVNAGR